MMKEVHEQDKADWKEQLKRLMLLSWANILTYLVQLTIPVPLLCYIIFLILIIV